MKSAPTYEKNGYLLRLGKSRDLDEYYRQGFEDPDPEVMRLTGSGEFSREEVENYFIRCLDAADRYEFLIISPQGKIIGESVINEIDWEIRKANFRIAVFNSKDCGKRNQFLCHSQHLQICL